MANNACKPFATSPTELKALPVAAWPLRLTLFAIFLSRKYLPLVGILAPTSLWWK